MSESISEDRIREVLADTYRAYAKGEEEGREDTRVHGDDDGVFEKQIIYGQAGRRAVRTIAKELGIHMQGVFPRIDEEESLEPLDE